LNISHDVKYREQCKAIERMAKRWLKEYGHFRVIFETIGDDDLVSQEKLVFKEDGPILGKYFEQRDRRVLDRKD